MFCKKSFLFDRQRYCYCLFISSCSKVKQKMGEPSATPTPTADEDPTARPISLTIKWSNSEYLVDELTASDTVADLKSMLYSKTFVKPARQKLMGLKTKNGSILGSSVYC